MKFNTFNKIKTYLKNLYFKYITKPKLEKEKKIKNEKIKKEFEEKQRATIKRIKEIMFHEKVFVENNNRLKYLNEKLVEGRNNIIKSSNYTSHIPAFYEPKICDIHNENLHLKNKTLDEIILEENNIAEFMLKKQINKFGYLGFSKPSTYWEKRSELINTVNNSMGKLSDDKNDDTTLSYRDFIDIDNANHKKNLIKLKDIINESRKKMTDG
jgi:hypothetical protein